MITGLYQRVLLICGLFCWSIDTQLTLTTLSTQNKEKSYVCGRPETLICTMRPSVQSMTWEIDFTQAAYCSDTECNVNQHFKSAYTFKFNLSAGLFHLTKHNVTLSDNGTVFICENGSSSASEQAVVIVIDDYTFENVTSVDDSSSTKHVKYSITTACLKATTADSVRFEWYFRTKKRNGSRKQYEELSNEQTVGIKNNSDCKPDLNCSVKDSTKLSSVIDIKEDEHGDTCYFEVKIYFGIKTVNVQFDTGIKCKDPTEGTSSVNLGGHIVGSTFSSSCLVVMATITVNYFVLRRKS